MKKKFVILLCLISFFAFYKSDNLDKTELVFDESTITYHENIYNFYEISLEDANITTDNLKTIFNDVKIISIYPNIPKEYENKIKNQITEYYFSYMNIDRDIKDFTDSYNKTLLKNGIKTYNSRGVRLKKIKIYSTYSDIELIVNKNNKLKIL